MFAHTDWAKLMRIGGILLACAFVSVMSAAVFGQQTDTGVRRGFTIDKMDESTLQKAAEKWHANHVRFMMRPIYRAQRTKGTTYAQAWEKMLAELPAQLDNAKKYNLNVTLCLFDVPNQKSADYPKGKEAKSAFWNDESNLEIMIASWRQIATLCKDRQQSIWFEILNEPLDWADFPGYVKRWPDWAQKTIDAIREIDTSRPIVVEAGPGGLCWGFKNFPVLRGDPIIYSTHNYQPHVYTHQGIAEIKATDLQKAYLEKNLPWPGVYSDSGGGMWDKERMRKELAPLIDFQKRTGKRIYISEFSVVKWAPNGDRYLRDCLEIYEELGWDWAYHALDENPIWSLEHNDQFEMPGKAKPVQEPGSRAQVMTEYLDRNLQK